MQNPQTFKAISLIVFAFWLSWLPVAQAETVLKDGQLDISSVIYQSEDGESQFWAKLRNVPSDNGDMLFEVIEYGDENGTLLNESNILTQDLHLRIPKLTFQQGTDQSMWWGLLRPVSNDEGRLLFEATTYGPFLGDSPNRNRVLLGMPAGASVEIFQLDNLETPIFKTLTDNNGYFNVTLSDPNSQKLLLVKVTAVKTLIAMLMAFQM